MKKVCVVITARPSYSRIRTALFALRDAPDVELQIVAAASAVLDLYGRVANEIQMDGFDLTATVHNLISGETLATSAQTTGLGIIELSMVFEQLKPDMVVTIADRFETMATAIAASYMNIPLIHIQGGEVTGNIDEKVRHAVTKLADLHLVSTQKAQERVIKMGEDPAKVIITGCPSIDIAKQVRQTRTGLDFDPGERYPGVGCLLPDRNKYLIVMLHPVTTELTKARKQTEIVLNAVVKLGIQVYWFWPNVDAGTDNVTKAIRHFRETRANAPIYFIKNMAPDDFLVLADNSICILGNSSVGLRECSYLGVPAINIGSRQSGRERAGNVIDIAFSEQQIFDSFQHVLNSPRPKGDPLYGDGNAGKRIASCICGASISVTKRLYY